VPPRCPAGLTGCTDDDASSMPPRTPTVGASRCQADANSGAPHEAIGTFVLFDPLETLLVENSALRQGHQESRADSPDQQPVPSISPTLARHCVAPWSYCYFICGASSWVNRAQSWVTLQALADSEPLLKRHQIHKDSHTLMRNKDALRRLYRPPRFGVVERHPSRRDLSAGMAI
jgi:hypothetical protein